MKEADWDMDNQINEESKDLADFVPKNENEEFEAFRKAQVISISYFLFREERNSILTLRDTETSSTPLTNLALSREINTLIGSDGWFLKRKPMFALDKTKLEGKIKLHILKCLLTEAIDASTDESRLNDSKNHAFRVRFDKIEDFSNFNIAMCIQ